jgi:hypothetical protein
VEEKHVLDEGETDDLTGGEENRGERAEDVVSLERLAEDGTEDEESADELGPVGAGKSVLRNGEEAEGKYKPEEDGKTTPEVKEGDPNQTA